LWSSANHDQNGAGFGRILGDNNVDVRAITTRIYGNCHLSWLNLYNNGAIPKRA